jgi:hypothetical protein
MPMYINKGIGSLWTINEITGPRSSNCPYKASLATTEFRKISNCSTAKVPTETDFDRNGGTFCTHWDEVCLKSELMTGFLENNNQSSHPLSRITIAGLDDLGYTVDYTTADPFTVDDLDETCQCQTPSLLSKPTRQHRKQLRSAPHMDAAAGVYQFGLLGEDNSLVPSSTRQRRRISDEAHQIATTYGLTILDERRNDLLVQNQLASAVSNENNGDTTTTTTATTRYVGDQVISVLIEEDGEIYGVMVINDDEV